MMSEKTSIKIIKRSERERTTQAVVPRKGKEDVARDRPRDVTSTVAGWVRDFQHRRTGRTGV
ncbi:MAG TPA: hypothetical protein VM911_18420 [Pyrinomonadaceae bacterium]|jgi:hypothetical protein|nr:hypothetical protein [Pyrinomonadaceae bacterium]